jgi:hypothetical protein
MERLALSLRPAAKAEGTKTDLKVVDSVPDTVKGDALPGSEFRSSVEMRRVATLPSGLQVFRQYYLFEGERMPSYLMHLLGKEYEKDGKKGKTPDLMLMLLNNKAGKEPATVRVELTLLEFSEPSARTVTIKAGETEAVSLSPVFAKSLYDLTEQKPGAVRLRVTDPSGRLLHEETEKVVLLGRNDFFWKDGTGRSWAPALSAFVTPHDTARKVDALLRLSKDHCPLDAMLGYQDVKGKERSAVVLLQMKAVYEALAATGWSYVNAPMSADARAQRIKFPTETLEDRSGNCIEAVLVFASAFESMGMRPVILVYEDHAQVAVRSWIDDPALIVLETTLCGRAPFEEACKKGFERFKKSQDGKTPPEAVDVRQWRLTGFTPVPR